MYMCLACSSKHNSNHEKKAIILMIPNGGGWHCFTKKSLALLRGITSKHVGDLYF